MNTQLCAIRIETLGCRLNQAEAESFAVLCVDAGFSLYTGHTGIGYTAVPTNAALTNGAETGAVGVVETRAAGVVETRAADVTETGIADVVEDSTLKAFKPVSPLRFHSALPSEQTVLCFVNTCTVTGKAEQKARRLLRLLVKTHPYAVILVTGCYAQLETAEIEALHPHILAFPGQQKDLLAEIPAYFGELIRSSAYFDTAFFLSALRTYLTGLTNRSLQEKPPHNRLMHNMQHVKLFALSTPRFLFHSRALLKIQDGCNEACAYCRIRLARGKSVSLPAAEVLERLHRIEAAGIPELTLTGVNLSQYRSEVGDFADMLKLILEHSRLRIRISSLYPDRIDATLIPLLEHPHVCPHFHLSVQSGCDTVLKAMHRSYKHIAVYQAVSELRRIKDNPFIGADIITGFPGETEDDFEETYRMCRELNFSGIHAFPFSARPGTEAWNMQPQIPQRIARQRVKKLNELAKTQAAAYLHAWDGKCVYGVIEAPHNNFVTVITENYLSLSLMKASLPDGTVLHGGEYVRVQVQGKNAVLKDIIPPLYG